MNSTNLTSHTSRGRNGASRLLTIATTAALFAGIAIEAQEIEEIIVEADASVLANRANIGSSSVVDADAIKITRANHVHETLVRVPGVWISRGSGQEHLTAIRSGVLTGAGACGGFLFLENGVPIRPAGFCNVNNLFEVNTEQATAIEVMRGPGSALFGGNALHGVINTVSISGNEGTSASLEVGPYEYVQARAAFGNDRLQISANATGSYGYRDDTGYGQQKLTGSYRTEIGDWQATHFASLTSLNQETGGFVRGFKAYEDPTLKRTNPNPEAYRDAWSFRASSQWRRELGSGELNVTPYVRRSGMAFLQHFLPGQPLERNDQTSAGALGKILGGGDMLRWSVGANIEALDGSLSEFQANPTTGSAFLVGTRPAGTHYDYDVESLMAAVFYDVSWRPQDKIEIVHSLRLERLEYEYDNLHLVGNTRDDGTECGFGGCLYTRPADRDDTFSDVGGRLGANIDLSETVRAFIVAGVGFRPPQTTELYRLQSGQTVANLDSETLESVEIGIRGTVQQLDYNLALYAQNTDNLIFRDSEGFNVSDGKTKAHGVEFDLAWHKSERHTLSVTGTYAEHEYDFTRDVARGEVITSGNEVDTAPKWLASAHWLSQLGALTSEFEISYIGSHYINASNTAMYGGHALVHWRASYEKSERTTFFVRGLNLLAKEYADRADFAFGSYRYFPGMPRQVYLGIEMSM